MENRKALKEWEQRDAATIRFGLISDVHVQDTTFTLDLALEAFQEISGLNGLLLLGDIMFQDGAELEEEKYDLVRGRLEEKAAGIPFAYAIGNHEFPILAALKDTQESVRELFAQKIGQPVKHHMVMDGYHFITEDSATEPDIDWIMQWIQTAVAEDPKRPVFLMLHNAFRDMVLFRDQKSEWSIRLQELLRAYPQVIALIGHIHVTSHDPNVIAQDGFTVVQAPCLGEIGYIAGDGLFGDYDVPGVPEAMMIEIEENVVSVYRMDLEKREYIGEPFVIDVPALAAGGTQYYPYKRRKTESHVPYFEDGSQLTVRQVSENCVELCIPRGCNEPMNAYSQDGFVIAYQTTVQEVDTDCCVFSEKVISDYYKVSRPEEISKHFYKRVKGLEAGKSYLASVTPISPFRKEGEAIATTFVCE